MRFSTGHRRRGMDGKRRRMEFLVADRSQVLNMTGKRRFNNINKKKIFNSFEKPNFGGFFVFDSSSEIEA